MKNESHFPDVDRMPDHPALPVPSLHALNERFRQALLDERNRILRRDEYGNPIFGAYIGSDSNELITWVYPSSKLSLASFKPFYCCFRFCSECSHSWPKPLGHFYKNFQGFTYCSVFKVLHC